MKYRYLPAVTLMMTGAAVFLLARFPMTSSGQEEVPTSRVPPCG